MAEQQVTPVDSDPSFDEALRQVRGFTAADRPAVAALERAREAQQAAVQAKYLRDCAVTAMRKQRGRS